MIADTQKTVVDLALAYQSGKIDREQMEWILASQEKRDHITSVYTTEVSPQQVATILINDWAPVQERYELEYGDVPAWRVRECINRYLDDTVSKKNMIILFEHYAEKAAKLRKLTIEELADEYRKQH
jgi:Glu-tRNA(Gln) amidotransferase subunit E-like FAD-binding protein